MHFAFNSGVNVMSKSFYMYMFLLRYAILGHCISFHSYGYVINIIHNFTSLFLLMTQTQLMTFFKSNLSIRTWTAEIFILFNQDKTRF